MLGLACGLVACASGPQATEPVQAAPPATPAPRVARAPGPIGIIPPNASRVTAAVAGRAVWPPEALVGLRPAVRPGRTLYSLTLQIVASTPTSPDVGSLARPGTAIEAFSSDPLAPELVGTEISAVVELTGTTEGTRWLISDIRPSE